MKIITSVKAGSQVNDEMIMEGRGCDGGKANRTRGTLLKRGKREQQRG